MFAYYTQHFVNGLHYNTADTVLEIGLICMQCYLMNNFPYELNETI